MGTGLVGADVEALNELQLSFRRHAGSLQSTMGSASGGIAALGPIWHGADSAQFQSAWQSIHRPALQRALHSLSEAAATIQRNADAQERTSAVDGSGVGAWAPGLIPFQSPGGQTPGGLPGADPASTGLTPVPVDEVFTEYYMDNFIGREFQGQNSPELNSLMEQLLADDGSDPQQLRATLDRIAAIRGVDPIQFRAQYDRYLELSARAEARGGPQDGLDLNRHGDFLGTSPSLRYGSIVGDVLGVDPVFGALLNPSGGLVGPGNDAYAPGDDDALGYHGTFHDAGGYLATRQGLGPGYNYLNREPFDERSPTTGQASGIEWWVGQHPELDVDISDLYQLAGDTPLARRLDPILDVAHRAGAEEVIGEVIQIGDGGAHIVLGNWGTAQGTAGVSQGLLDLAHGQIGTGVGRIGDGLGQVVDGLGQTANGANTIINGTIDNAVDFQLKQVDNARDLVGTVVDHLPDPAGPIWLGPVGGLSSLWGR